jgi:hypothetical protein
MRHSYHLLAEIIQITKSKIASESPQVRRKRGGYAKILHPPLKCTRIEHRDAGKTIEGNPYKISLEPICGSGLYLN